MLLLQNTLSPSYLYLTLRLEEEELLYAIKTLQFAFNEPELSVAILHSVLKGNLLRDDIPIELASYFHRKLSKGVFASAWCCKGRHREGSGTLSDKSGFGRGNKKKKVRFEIDEPPLYFQYDSVSNGKLFETGLWGSERLYKTIYFDSDCTIKCYPLPQVSWISKKTKKSCVININFEDCKEGRNFLSAASANVHLPLFMKCLQRVHSQMHHYLDTDWNVGDHDR